MVDSCLELTDSQFSKLNTAQKLDILYVNQKETLSRLEGINVLRRYQKMQWWSLGALTSAFGWLFFEFFSYIKT